jgi:uncharacterized peroxidase-related enzyme
MPYVNEVEETQADAHLREIYRSIEKNFGFIPHYFKALGAIPKAIEGQLQLSAAVMGEGALSTLVKEQIGVVVSGINASSYCMFIHMELLQRFGMEKTQARKLTNNYEAANVEPNVKALFRFADKLTRKPHDIEDEDIEALKKTGWNEVAIREAVLTVSYFNYVNRVSLGLGLVADF